MYKQYTIYKQHTPQGIYSPISYFSHVSARNSFLNITNSEKGVVFSPEGSCRIFDFSTFFWFHHLSLKTGVTVWVRLGAWGTPDRLRHNNRVTTGSHSIPQIDRISFSFILKNYVERHLDTEQISYWRHV